MAQKIRLYGNPVLQKVSAPVEEFGKKLRSLIEGMEKTLHTSGGIGLAAPQIGVSLRLFLASDREGKRLHRIINPVIVEMEGSDIDMEGCLSFPEIYLSISRPTRVVIEGFGPNGKKIVREAKGLLARCFLHEIDHLNGTLIIDHISPEERIPWEEEIAKLLQQKRR